MRTAAFAPRSEDEAEADLDDELVPVVAGHPAGRAARRLTVKFPATAEPPVLSLSTCLMTIKCAGCAVFVTVQLLVSPSAIVPVQPVE